MSQLIHRAGLIALGIVIGALLYAWSPELMHTEDTSPPANLVVVSERIHTAGQPSEEQLGGLRAAGYQLVINLAPPTTFGSIPNEGQLVAQSGIPYINIPVDRKMPRYEDFALFSAVLEQSKPRRVLVHCQINQRASVFTFLYRVIYEQIPPVEAWTDVTAIWVPNARWSAFVHDTLQKHGIAFDPELAL
jgi:protein tyrosine phosphatase (PTP) superfamily phosphohydrolase (DUF442 family)